jgi:hypothetical protein
VVGDGDADVAAASRLGATSIRIGDARVTDELVADDLVGAAALVARGR